MNITSEVIEAKNQKRRPERSKGTGKKVKETIIPPKRPVGRPRKDGLPSGSATVRPQRFISHPVKDDDWGEFSQNEPDIFLSSLVVALSALSSPTPSGPSAEETFRSHLNSLAPRLKHNRQLPALYSTWKTFWLPTSPAYFSLTASTSARVLSDHRFFYWDPHLLVLEGILCPSCSSPLHNEGRIKQGPLKIYDVERPFFIIGAEYICQKEGRRFASTDPSILRALPGKLRDELPVRLVHVHKDVGCDENVWCWKPAGVSKTLWNLVSRCLKSGLQKDTIVELIKAVQKDQLQVVESSILSNLEVGFTPEADKCVWTTNTAPAHEDNDTQELYPLTQSFDSYDHTTTVFFPSNSIRSEPENSLVGIVTQTQLPGGRRNHVLNDTTIHAQTQSSASELDHSEQWPMTSSSLSRPLPVSITPALEHPASKALSASSLLLPSDSNSNSCRYIFDYPHVPTNYSVHCQPQQWQQQSQSYTSDPFLQTELAELDYTHSASNAFSAFSLLSPSKSNSNMSCQYTSDYPQIATNYSVHHHQRQQWQQQHQHTLPQSIYTSDPFPQTDLAAAQNALSSRNEPGGVGYFDFCQHSS